jgi:hypothetical protein
VTTPDEYELRQQRDDDLVDGFRERAKSMMIFYQAWIQSELIEDIKKAGLLEATSGESAFKQQLQLKIDRLKQINLHELPEAVRNVTEKCNELRRGGSADILEDYRYLQDCLSRLHGLVRELLDIRRMLDTASD